MEILMSGELYIKRKPDIFETNIDSLERLEAMREDPTIPEEVVDVFEEAADVFSKYMLNSEGKLDYSGCDSFWISVIDDDRIKMIEQTKYYSVYPMTKSYESKEDMEEDFISLREFLSKAEYVGRYFKFTKETARNLSNTQKLLYKTDDIWIIEEDDIIAGHNFRVFSKHLLHDINDYIFSDGVDETYRNPAVMYQTIFKQISDDDRRKKL